ncbi:hydroxyphenylacetyl-CoA thioesterase PaaI [Klugiella xanthotipulae]|uniref:Acyl-CoA thioesterase n=1 Tax=Klugiella xanthotipulae TaxID=244735 RepID=A0A543I734_9MICO|nr:hydroxyphenylacetyl-CoA thioesterase PaaI [Klugiella xanthotipulae]TQM66413.1 acyl-CoA thioesterase [Klugiella xanthotipulae]
MTDVTHDANQKMIARDRATAALGITVHGYTPGNVSISMPIRDDMINGFDVTHGGYVFTLADTAFAIACNLNDNVTLAAGADITFLKATRKGQTLTATAEVRVQRGRSGIYDVRVTDETGDVVAEFRGRSRTTTMSTPTTA